MAVNAEKPQPESQSILGFTSKFSGMEKKNPGKTLAFRFLLCFFLICKISKSSSSAPPPALTFSHSPTSSPPLHDHPPSSTHANLRRILLGILFGCITGAFASIIFLFSIRLFILFANRTPILKGPVIFYPKISPKSLKVIFAGNPDPSQMLGSSPNGTYFRLQLNSELTVAVKVVQTSYSTGSPGTNSNSWKRKVQRELELLAKVSHRNVMSLRAYVRDRERFSLVYDFIPNGSLDDAMKRVRLNQLRLGWELRHRIAVGMVKGLKYLHFECIPRILHYNLKPTNVLLDEDFDTKLGDCGLTRLVMAAVDASISSCYVAPECFQSCRYTDKSDIYSFGVILSMLLTGRDPGDPFFREEAGRGGLGPWLRHLQQVGEAREALDSGIVGEGEEDEMLMAVRIALVCLSDLPADRPSSDELEAMLTQLHSF